MDGAQGSLAQQLARPQRAVRDDPPVRRRAAGRPRASRSRRRAGATMRRSLELFNGFGGFRDDGREYVIRVERARRPLPPAPWSNVVAQPAVRLRLHRVGLRLHVVGEQPRQPADAVAQRSGRATTRRGRVHSRRGDRGVLVGDAAPAGRRWALHRPPRPGLHAIRARAPRLASELTLFVPPDDPVKIFRLALAQPVVAPAPAVGHAVRRMGARREQIAHRERTS